MKQTHRPDLHTWSVFDTARDLDFNGWAWARPDGNVLIDPVPLSPHDLEHLRRLGGVARIVLTNSDHVRAAPALKEAFGATVVGPAAERDALGRVCDAFAGDGDEIVPGLAVLALDGSKTPGELALVLEETTLITGDLVRGHRGGRLNLLPDPKLADKAAAVASVRRLAELPRVDAVLVGDGWPVFRDGRARLAELVASI